MRLLLLACMAACASGGAVQGVVLEFASGLPMARVRVTLQPVPSANAPKPIQVRAGSGGQFVFPSVPDGLWFLVANREGYFPCYYAQRRSTGQGLPFEVTSESKLFAELRMRRKGAITGKVLDENGLGIEGVPVFAYRTRLPLVQAGRAVSDDRGVYRIHGLDPGKYWIRTGSTRLDDGTGLLPTFGLRSRESTQARVHQVQLENDTQYGDVSPDQGSLATLTGMIQCPPLPPGQVTVILSSETERRRTQAGCMSNYTFESIPPGNYELFATRGETESGYVEFFFSGRQMNLQLLPSPTVYFESQVGSARAARGLPGMIVGRRRDFWSTEEARELEPRTTMAAGHWEINARLAANQYLEAVDGSRSRRIDRAEQPPSWFDMLIEPIGVQRIVLSVSDQAAQIEGRVSAQGSAQGRGVPGAPVFLWPDTESARRSLGGARVVNADPDGHFLFQGVPPGTYRLLATFDVLEIDEDVLMESQAQSLTLGKSARANVELSLWIAP